MKINIEKQFELPQRRNFKNSFFVVLSIFLLCIQQCFSQPKPIKIGVLSGLNGAAAKWNKYQNMGVTLAQEEFNAKGWKVDVIFEDSGTAAAKAISAFNKLLAFDKVNAIFADDFSFVLQPLVPLTKQKKTFLTALGLHEDKYCHEGGGYFYSMASQYRFTSDTFEQFFILHPEVKKMAIIAFDDPDWGGAYRKIWTDLAKKHSVEIVETYVTNDFRPDFKNALAKILAKKPDVIFQAHEPDSFFKAIKQYDYKGKIVVANNVFEMLVDSPSGRNELEGAYVVNPIIAEDFRNRFNTRFHLEPILDAYAGYDGLKTILLSFEKNFEHPETAIKSVIYEGVAGPVRFPESGCAGNQANWGLFQFNSKGLAEQVWPVLR